MDGRVALVTGATGGLGNVVTQMLLDAGFRVAGVSRKIQQSDFASPLFTALRGEITTAEGARSVVAQALDRLGRLDVLVHIVGGYAGGQSIAETDDALYQKMLDLNLHAVFQILRAAIPALRRSPAGRIIAIGGRAAVEPAPGNGAYNAAKAAMLALVRTAALENRDAGVTANVILPGTMDTAANRAADPQADVSKWVRPATVASLVVWLAGEGGKEVNGAAIPVYGPDA